MKKICYIVAGAILVLTLDAFVVRRVYSGTAVQLDAIAFVAANSALAFGLAVIGLHLRLGRVVALAVGLALALVGWFTATLASPQVETYNKALIAMDNQALPQAIKLFDESLALYKKQAEAPLVKRLFAPKVRKDLEALALFHKANCFVALNKGKEAVDALKKSLAANPGNCYAGLDLATASRRYLEALQAQSNLEKLFKSGQSGGHATGPGGGQGQPQPGNQPGRERQPQPGSGKQERDAL